MADTTLSRLSVFSCNCLFIFYLLLGTLQDSCLCSWCLLLLYQLYGIKNCVVRKLNTVKENQLALIVKVVNVFGGTFLHKYVKAVCPLSDVTSFYTAMPYCCRTGKSSHAVIHACKAKTVHTEILPCPSFQNLILLGDNWRSLRKEVWCC